MPRGQNFHSLSRSSWKRWRTRPPANCLSARDAWDYFTHNPRTIVCMWLDDGYWSAELANGDYVDCENTFGANRRIRRETEKS